MVVSAKGISPENIQQTKTSLAPDLYERILAFGSVILALAVVIAVIKGAATWHKIPANVWVHLALIFLAVALTPIMLLRKRGDKLHRRLGWIWASSMFLTALVSFDIRMINAGQFSFIHLLSALTVIQVPRMIWHARKHDIPRHRRAVKFIVTGALLIAGFFTFPFNRLMGQWLFG